eukprot:220181_1
MPAIKPNQYSPLNHCHAINQCTTSTRRSISTQDKNRMTPAIHSKEMIIAETTINSPTNTIDLDEYEYEEEEPPQRNAQCHSITIQNTRQNRTIPTIIRTRGA